jgi:ribosomal protein L11 methylase PrmA
LYARDWSELAIQSDHAHFETATLKPELVERKWHEAYRRFYFRPQRITKRLLSVDTWRNLVPRLKDAQRFFTS